jgi:hypothetical protein
MNDILMRGTDRFYDFKIIGEDKGFAEGRGEKTEEYIFRLSGEIQ